MTHLSLYQVDAFTSQLFAGNPAGVIPLDTFLPDDLMQKIAEENNLSETAFVVSRSDGTYDLRWFTPLTEIEFCGHATVAAAHVLIAELGKSAPLIFHTQIGRLTVGFSKAGYTLHAPNYPMQPHTICSNLTGLFNTNIVGAYLAVHNLYVELETAQIVYGYKPDISALAHYLKTQSSGTAMGLTIMAAGTGKFAQYDFVSRHFAPLHGVDEDPVTGSAHSALAPFWANKLGTDELFTKQCSARGGELSLNVLPNEVQITGQAITYLRGNITRP